MEDSFYAKSLLPNGTQPTVAEHISQVSEEAKRYGAEFGHQEEAHTAGLFHDVGKYSDHFQELLKGQRQGVDHAFASAALLYGLVHKRGRTNRAFVPIIEAVNAHHSTLKPLGDLEKGIEQSLTEEARVEGNQGKTSALAGKEYPLAFAQFRKDFPQYRPPQLASYPCTATEDIYQTNLEWMLFTRFVFSCLVDADYSVSANEEDSTYLRSSQQSQFEPGEVLKRLYKHRDEIRNRSTSNSELNALRDQLFEQCGKMGEHEPGLFTLTAPTGTGKTLALLHFALRHCLKNGQRRIIIVLPFLTLTDQNAREYRRIVPDLLEDHSQKELDEVYREFSQRWSVPVIVTTSVRFFETLFASRPTDCRKLHSIANSVVVFDEAQSLPIHLTEPTLRAVKELCRSYRTTMVFSTATQPEFAAIQGLEWHSTEIVPDYPKLFQQLQRTTVRWRLDSPTPLETIAEEMAGLSSVCTIVNLRKHARKLYQILTELSPQEECFFLTTDLCPAHRKNVVEEVNQRLEAGLACRVVATQCIEAGVDFDFAALYRSLAPLESIIQAAGRCNRNGKATKGIVTVFVPEQMEGERLYPEEWYQLAAEVVRAENEKDVIDIHNPAHISRYYRRLFQMEKEKRKKELIQAVQEKDYEAADKNYQLISDRGVRVIVPYLGQEELFRKIQAQLREGGEITPALMKQAAPITISYYDEELLSHWAEPLLLPERRGRESEANRQSGWYLLSDERCYNSRKLGLHFPEAREMLF